MGKFNYLLGEGKELVIGEESYICRPLSARYLTLFMDSDDKDEVVYKLVAATLAQTDSEITVEDVKDMPLSIFQKVSEIVLELNNLKDQ